jgi:hypothetical protein
MTNVPAPGLAAHPTDDPPVAERTETRRCLRIQMELVHADLPAYASAVPAFSCPVQVYILELGRDLPGARLAVKVFARCYLQ